MSLESIPSDVINLITSNLHINDIIRLCTTNSNFRQLCNNENMWRLLVQRDFSQARRIGNSWFLTYQYYNRTVYSFIAIDSNRLTYNLIFDRMEDALNAASNITSDHVMSEHRYPDLQLSDDILDIDQNIGAEHGKYVRGLIEDPQRVKEKFIQRYDINNFPSFQTMTNDQLYQLLVDYLRVRAEYDNRIMQELHDNGSVTIYEHTYYLSAQKIF